MARKKIIFVIVEGPSDEEALGVILERYFDKSTVYLHIMRCDITSENGSTLNNITNKISEVVRRYANHIFKPSDFCRIIHITDTDGTFIPDDKIIENAQVEKPVYSTTEITAPNKKNIEERNHKKSAILHRLSITPKIWKIPYQIYYMSCNLDHVLYDKLNSSDIEKEENAYKFAEKYKDDIQGCIQFFNESDFSVVGDYKQSWEYIEKDLHSLERHTNFGLCFEKDGDNDKN